ncbi:hypothetical protein H8N03_00210 [Ramlibacter sp. USB13]|uniref:Uncharacterized protein n=1 Tax=Ramlibacter cellulosilyticus TaxID=2764187 RepID=A0A923S937_9BURK|nr:hypothetical protein [Ramlibacter cellulosilyticus]MBC5781344.1 hypothetical protein [Ramlibacter cellulosilyticus]
MPTEPNSNPNPTGTEHEDEAIPSASDDRVIEETARMAREGRKERDADPNEPKPQRE